MLVIGFIVWSRRSHGQRYEDAHRLSSCLGIRYQASPHESLPDVTYEIPPQDSLPRVPPTTKGSASLPRVCVRYQGFTWRILHRDMLPTVRLEDSPFVVKSSFSWSTRPEGGMGRDFLTIATHRPNIHTSGLRQMCVVRKASQASRRRSHSCNLGGCTQGIWRYRETPCIKYRRNVDLLGRSFVWKTWISLCVC